MRLRMSIGIALTFALAVGVFAGGASARVVTESEVTIKPFLPLYHGKVKSAFDECIDNRKVLLYKVKPGRDNKIGLDRANGNGKWQVDAPASLAPGDRFYAKVRNYSVSSTGTGLDCIRDKSPTITFVGD